MNFLILALAAITLSPLKRRALALSLDGFEATDDLIPTRAGPHPAPVIADASQSASRYDQPAPEPASSSPAGAGWNDLMKEVA